MFYALQLGRNVNKLQSFSSFIDNHYGKKFVGLVYAPQTQNALRSFCLSNKLDINVGFSQNPITPLDFEFHTTLFYCQEENKRALPNGLFTGPFVEVTGDHYEVLGPEQNCLCLCLQDSPTLNAMRRSLWERYGLIDSWPTFKPHITLTYNYQGQDFPSLPTTKLWANNFRVENIIG